MSAQEALGYLKARIGTVYWILYADKVRSALAEVEAALRFDAMFEEMRLAGLDVSLYGDKGYSADAETEDAKVRYQADGDTASGAVAALYQKWVQAGKPRYA